jgi:hypothetical protein
MGASWQKCLSSGFLLIAGLQAFPQRSSDRGDTTLRITIRVSDLVGIQRLPAAEKVASRIFQQAGVRTRWLSCPLSLTATRTNNSCEEPWGPADFAFRINDRAEARKNGVPDAVGYAFPFAGRSYASISYELVQQLAKASEGRASLAAILGHVMAHEIGHLVLRSERHSQVGIMRAKWNVRDLENAAQGHLTFTPEESANLRHEVLLRVPRADSVDAEVVGPRRTHQSPETELKIEVHIYNYAGVVPELLAPAQQEAARIYRRASIAMEWRDCPRTPEEAVLNTICDGRSGPTTIILRLCSNEMAPSFPVGGDIFGFALLPSNHGFGVTANVFAARAQEMAVDGETQRAILGHVIAHEFGHLLLGEAGHPAGAGIMRVPWGTKELQGG